MRRLLWLLGARPAFCPRKRRTAEFFEKRVRPLFAAKCYGCHGDKVKMGGLSLSTRCRAGGRDRGWRHHEGRLGT